MPAHETGFTLVQGDVHAGACVVAHWGTRPCTRGHGGVHSAAREHARPPAGPSTPGRCGHGCSLLRVCRCHQVGRGAAPGGGLPLAVGAVSGAE